MRLLLIMLMGLLVWGCASQATHNTPEPEPKPEPINWIPASASKAIVVFNDDSDPRAQLRDSGLADQLRAQAEQGFKYQGYDAVDGSALTSNFLTHNKRRGPSEVKDSLPMLEGWGYALALAYFIQDQQVDEYRKLSLRVSATLYNTSSPSPMAVWNPSQSQHVVVANDCNEMCVQSALIEPGKRLVMGLVNQSLATIENKQQPKKPAPKTPEPKKPQPKPVPDEPEPMPEPEKGQWQPINF